MTLLLSIVAVSLDGSRSSKWIQFKEDINICTKFHSNVSNSCTNVQFKTTEAWLTAEPYEFALGKLLGLHQLFDLSLEDHESL